MRILVVGAGGVGSAAVSIALRRDVFDHVVVADFDIGRAQRAAASGGERTTAVQVDATDERAVA
ncbi:MAG: saccharopine dehydrogenase NADP-binding domain-containing protein, partial [Actinomycetota bacterium]|nr:saccharopine dehydrogenase NADP-binding domain-containing protein [Actinomycetota bacterium]